MAMKMLMFDYRESEKEFFNNNKFEDFDITFFSFPLNKYTLKDIPQNLKNEAEIISVFISSELTEEVINEFKNLRIISTRSTGVNHISKQTCQDKNIEILNVKSYGATSVAQYIFGLMISLIRNIIPASQYIKIQKENLSDFTGRDLTALTLGVIGTGAIGAAVCDMAYAAGMKILAFDLYKNENLINKYNIEYVEFEELLKNSDVISLHIPFTGNNKNMFSKKEFALMKENSYFINAARGELVNLPDLYEAVQSKHLKGVALDVTPCENVTFNCKSCNKHIPSECAKIVDAVNKLEKLDNVIITPHIAYDTVEAVNYILKMSFNGIKNCLNNK